MERIKLKELVVWYKSKHRKLLVVWGRKIGWQIISNTQFVCRG